MLYDSNRPSLIAQLKHEGYPTIDGGIAKDTQAAIEKALLTLARKADIIIASGGVSVGEYDYVKDLVTKHGSIRTYKVAMKPGKPLVTGSIRTDASKITDTNEDHSDLKATESAVTHESKTSLFFGLPGNPVSSFVCYEVFVKPALAHCHAGQRPSSVDNTVLARSDIVLTKKPGREDYQRVVLVRQGDSYVIVESLGQDSHRVGALSKSNALAKLAANLSKVEPGDSVQCLIHAPVELVAPANQQ